MTEEAGRILLISDYKLSDPGGRAERFETRHDHLREEGWELIVGYVPEPYVAGFPRAVWNLTRLARREEVDVVNSVNNPFQFHVVGFLVSLLAGAKWLAEFRDPLVTNPALDDDRLGPLRKFVEWFAVHFADQVVWGNGIQVPEGYYEETYPRAADNVIRLPFAGYIAESFRTAPAEEYEDFTITYAGSFYEGWLEPHDFLRGLAAYVERREEDADGLTIQFYGDWTAEYQEYAEELGVADCVLHHEFVPHDEIIPVLKGSDALLYLGGTDKRNRRNVPSKVMDYIGARRPIFALVEEDFRVADLLETYGLGIVADPTDPTDVSNALERLEAGDVEYTEEESVFEQFTRRHKNEQLAEILETLVSEDG